jgi:hypothetical protein
VVIAAAIALEALSYALKFADLASYHQNGVGWPWLRSLANLLDPASQTVLMGFMWLLASGCTILAGKDLPDAVQLTCAACVAAVYIMLVVFDGSVSHHTQWYPHEGLTGYIMVAMRLGAFACAIPAAMGTLATATNPKAKVFLRTFFTLSALYVLALPVCMLTAALFAPYYRKYVMELFQMGIQGVCVAALSRQVILRGDYYRLSSLGQSVLPSGKNQ